MSRLAVSRPSESRRAKGRCPICRRPVYRGGMSHAGRFWHESCFRRSSGAGSDLRHGGDG